MNGDDVIRVYHDAGNVIETHEHKGDFKEWWSFLSLHLGAPRYRRVVVEKITLSFAALATIIAMTIAQACVGTAGMQCANTDSLRRNACHDIRHGQDSDEDSWGFFALHARRFYADWRIVR
jgi:hypothetical protein